MTFGRCLGVALALIASVPCMAGDASNTGASVGNNQERTDTPPGAVLPMPPSPAAPAEVREVMPPPDDGRTSTEAVLTEPPSEGTQTRPVDITPEVHDILVALQEKYSSIKGFRAKVRYTSYDKVFEEAGTTRSGLVYVKKPCFLRLDYDKPTERVEIINDKEFIEFRPSLKTVTIRTRKEGEGDEGFFPGFSRTAGELERAFAVTLLGTEKTDRGPIHKLKLVPRDERDGDGNTFQWWINARMWLPVRIIVADNTKEWTYMLSDFDTKVRMTDRLFRPKWPADVTIDPQ